MQPKRPCSPGVYVGTYNCEISLAGAFSFPLMGDVKFTLAIDEQAVEKCPPGTEFCADLVISKNSGVLFGQAALLWGFETKLEGALDCTTGKFRASGLGGRWGGVLFNDPNNPDAWTVDEPPAGTFDGMLEGMHSSDGSQQTIAGSWKLTEGTLMEGLSCAGPFSVTLMP